jgi:hypothetical protein
MLSFSIWFSAPSFWMGGGLESRCVGRVYGADGAVRLDMSKMHGQTTLKFPKSDLIDFFQLSVLFSIYLIH